MTKCRSCFRCLMTTDGRTEGKTVTGVTPGCKGALIFNKKKNKIQYNKRGCT
jgi:hypothetical protein